MKINGITIKNKILKYFAPLLFRTRQMTDDFWGNVPEICIEKNDMEYLIHSTFNVINVKGKNVAGYFRECRRHVEKLEYVSELLNDYFTYVQVSTHAEAIKKELTGYLSINRNKSRFFNMGVKNDTNSGIARYYQNSKVTNILGIPDEHSEELDEILPDFLQFVWGEVYTYLLNRGIKRDSYQVFNTNRQVATYELARCLDAEELIPKTRYVKLIIDGKVKMGTFMDVAPGICPEHMEDSARHKINPELQRQLIRLNFLDILCRHTDHRPGHDGNYNVSFNEKGEVCGVSAFDNDAPTSFLPSGSIKFGTSAMTTSLITKDKIITRPFLCKDIVEKVMDVNVTKMKNSVGEYLSPLQCYFIGIRLQALKQSIKKSEQMGLVTCLERHMWSKTTIGEELALCKEGHMVSYLYSYYKMLY